MYKGFKKYINKYTYSTTVNFAVVLLLLDSPCVPKEVISAGQLLFLKELFHSGKKSTKSCKSQNKMRLVKEMTSK